jgi:uncharacterized iron-regulated membrane protein
MSVRDRALLTGLVGVTPLLITTGGLVWMVRRVKQRRPNSAQIYELRQRRKTLLMQLEDIGIAPLAGGASLRLSGRF